MVNQRISPAWFERLRETLRRAELEGCDPEECARQALDSVGLPRVSTNFIVDYSLTDRPED